MPHIYDEGNYQIKRSGIADRRASMTPEEIAELVENVVDKSTRKQCGEHSGMTAWIKVCCGLMGGLLAVFSYSTFVVAPDVKSSLDKQTSANEKRFYAIERDVADLKIVDVRIISQRNIDHSNRQKLQ